MSVDPYQFVREANNATQIAVEKNAQSNLYDQLRAVNKDKHLSRDEVKIFLANIEDKELALNTLVRNWFILEWYNDAQSTSALSQELNIQGVLFFGCLLLITLWMMFSKGLRWYPLSLLNRISGLLFSIFDRLKSTNVVKKIISTGKKSIIFVEQNLISILINIYKKLTQSVSVGAFCRLCVYLLASYLVVYFTLPKNVFQKSISNLTLADIWVVVFLGFFLYWLYRNFFDVTEVNFKIWATAVINITLLTFFVWILYLLWFFTWIEFNWQVGLLALFKSLIHLR